VFEPVRDDAQREGLHPGDGLISIGAVAQNTRQRRHFSEPATVGFPFELDREGHGLTVHSGSAAQQAAAPDGDRIRCLAQ